MPYINGRLIDTTLPNYSTFEPVVVRQATQRRMAPPTAVHIESYGNHEPFAVGCPGTRSWQRVVIPSVVTALVALNVSAVYIDQVGAAMPLTCDDTSHGHAVHTGRWWTDGSRCPIGVAL